MTFIKIVDHVGQSYYVEKDLIQSIQPCENLAGFEGVHSKIFWGKQFLDYIYLSEDPDTAWQLYFKRYDDDKD